MNRIIRLIMNQLLRRVVNRGVTMALDRTLPKAATPVPPGQNRQARETAKRARQAARMTRRLGR